MVEQYSEHSGSRLPTLLGQALGFKFFNSKSLGFQFFSVIQQRTLSCVGIESSDFYILLFPIIFQNLSLSL